jgi:hypothetical protein
LSVIGRIDTQAATRTASKPRVLDTLQVFETMKNWPEQFTVSRV